MNLIALGNKILNQVANKLMPELFFRTNVTFLSVYNDNQNLTIRKYPSTLYVFRFLH